MFSVINKVIDKLVYNSVRRSILDWPLDFGVETAVFNNVIGDYHEFGVLEGRSFIRNAKNFLKLLDEKDAKTMNFWAYDSFKGLPETSDPYAPSHFKKGVYAAPQDVFLSNVEKSGIARSQVQVVEGFYDQSLTDQLVAKVFSNRKVAMTYIDCDIYESTVPIFKFLTNGLQVGSVIVIDDWVRHHAHPKHGLQRAFYEWLEENPSIKVNRIALTKRVTFAVYEI